MNHATYNKLRLIENMRNQAESLQVLLNTLGSSGEKHNSTVDYLRQRAEEMEEQVIREQDKFRSNPT